MKSTHNNGAWWFSREIAEFLNLNKPITDNQYFFYNGGLISQNEIKGELRKFYCRILLGGRLSKYMRRLAFINKNYIHCNYNPGPCGDMIELKARTQINIEILNKKLNGFDFYNEAAKLKIFNT